MEVHGLPSLLRRFFAKRSDATETDPATLSRGVVLSRLGKACDKWGRPVKLVEVQVTEPKSHHKRGDIVIWEIPFELALNQFAGTREERLNAWYRSAT